MPRPAQLAPPLAHPRRVCVAAALAGRDCWGDSGGSFCTPLHRAAVCKQPEGAAADGVRLLLAAGADATAKNKYGFTALHWAAERGPDDPSLVGVLMGAGCDPAAKDSYLQTALDIAKEGNNRPRIFELAVHDGRGIALEPAQVDATGGRVAHHMRMAAAADAIEVEINDHGHVKVLSGKCGVGYHLDNWHGKAEVGNRQHFSTWEPQGVHCWHLGRDGTLSLRDADNLVLGWKHGYSQLVNRGDAAQLTFGTLESCKPRMAALIEAVVSDPDTPEEANQPEEARSYSSVWNGNAVGTGHARSTLGSAQAWSAQHNNQDQWVIIDLGRRMSVRGIIISGRHDHPQKVTRVRVEVADGAGGPWTECGEHECRVDNHNDEKRIDFGAATGRCVKLNPRAWEEHISMRCGVIALPLHCRPNPVTLEPFRAEVAALQQLVNERGLEAGLAAATSEEERLAAVRQMEPRYDDMVQRKDEFVEMVPELLAAANAADLHVAKEGRLSDLVTGVQAKAAVGQLRTGPPLPAKPPSPAPSFSDPLWGLGRQRSRSGRMA